MGKYDYENEYEKENDAKGAKFRWSPFTGFLLSPSFAALHPTETCLMVRNEMDINNDHSWY